MIQHLIRNFSTLMAAEIYDLIIFGQASNDLSRAFHMSFIEMNKRVVQQDKRLFCLVHIIDERKTKTQRTKTSLSGA